MYIIREHKGNAMDIVTELINPPIPSNCMDWRAYFKNRAEPDEPVGYGSTEQEAIDDLMMSVDE